MWILVITISCQMSQVWTNQFTVHCVYLVWQLFSTQCESDVHSSVCISKFPSAIGVTIGLNCVRISLLCSASWVFMCVCPPCPMCCHLSCDDKCFQLCVNPCVHSAQYVLSCVMCDDCCVNPCVHSAQYMLSCVMCDDCCVNPCVHSAQHVLSCIVCDDKCFHFCV